jgi:hypothetical protein
MAPERAFIFLPKDGIFHLLKPWASFLAFLSIRAVRWDSSGQDQKILGPSSALASSGRLIVPLFGRPQWVAKRLILLTPSIRKKSWSLPIFT